MSSTPKHSNLGPSSAERWMNCPGSVAALAMLPKQGSSSHAAEGTVAHALCEEYVTGKLSLKGLMGRIGRVTEEQGFEIEVTSEMVDAVIEYRDTIEADRKELGEKYPGVDIYSLAEVRVYATSVSQELYGTADYILHVPGKILKVYDFKYGKGVFVEVEGNKQMAIYALAAMDTLKINCPEVELVVIQPRTGGDSVRRWSPDKSWAVAFVSEVTKAVFATRQDNAPRRASAKACQWCAFKPACPEAHEFVQQGAALDFTDIPAQKPLDESVPIEKLVEAYQHREYVEEYFAVLGDYFKWRLEAGLPVPGYKLVEGRANRKFIDDLKVVEAFEDLLGLETLLEPRKLISPAKLEKIVGKGKLDHLTFKPEAGKSIARDSDPRPPVRNSVEADFDALPTPAPTHELDKIWP